MSRKTIEVLKHWLLCLCLLLPASSLRASVVTRYAYDEAGNEVAQVDALNRTNTYAYDEMGRRVSHTLPGSQTEHFGYDLGGNLLYTTNFNGVVISNRYDVLNRLTNRASVFGYNVSYAYSVTGQRTNMTDGSGTTVYSYDNRDRLTSKAVTFTGGPSVALRYRYDANGNLTNLWSDTASGVTNRYQYDTLNRLTSVLGRDSVAAYYIFDNVGNLQTASYGSGVTNLYKYDRLNRLTNAVWKLNATTVGSFFYTLNLSGVRTNLAETVNGSRSYAWQYDNLYRLTNENLSVSGVLSYGYDAVGNRTNRTSAVSGLAGQSLTFNTNDWQTSTDSYDDNGNTTGSGGNTYQYDALNRLTNVNSGTILLGYDGDGNRVSKKVGGTTTYYLVDDRNPTGYAQVVEEYQGSTLTAVYTHGLDLISQRRSGTVNYYVYDGHGSVRALTDTGGSVTDTYQYDAYGTKLSTSTGTTSNNYLYTCGQFDSDLGFYYLRARYYKPDTGRFWTSDTYKGSNNDPLSLHKYLYAQNDPVDNVDPIGLYSQEEGDAIHALIAADYALDHPKAENVTYGRVAHIGKNPLLKPDILNKDDKTYAEIKPLTEGKISEGFNQLRTYDDSLGGLNYTRDLWPLGSLPPIRITFYNWAPYFYFNVDGLILYTRIDPELFFIPVGKPITKEIAKDLAKQSAKRLAIKGATTLTKAIGWRAIAVGVADGAALGASVGTASANTAMGAE